LQLVVVLVQQNMLTESTVALVDQVVEIIIQLQQLEHRG
jgi:hypothetical protein